MNTFTDRRSLLRGAFTAGAAATVAIVPATIAVADPPGPGSRPCGGPETGSRLNLCVS
jgi:hypothetical protein